MIRLHTEHHDIVVSIERCGEWVELIRTHGALDHVTVDHHVSELGVDSAVAGKHRDQILDSIRELADWLDPDRIPTRPSHADQTTTLDLVAIAGVRDPETDEVTLVVRVADPRKVLRKGYGCIEGLRQLGRGTFTFDTAEIAERLSTLLAETAIRAGGGFR